MQKHVLLNKCPIGGSFPVSSGLNETDGFVSFVSFVVFLAIALSPSTVPSDSHFHFSLSTPKPLHKCVQSGSSCDPQIFSFIMHVSSKALSFTLCNTFDSVRNIDSLYITLTDFFSQWPSSSHLLCLCIFWLAPGKELDYTAGNLQIYICWLTICY